MESGTGDPVWRSDSKVQRIAVIAALDLEAKILRDVLPDGGGPIYVSGPGSVRAEATAQQAIAAGAQGLIAWGLAGGINRAAATGTVILPANILGDAGEWPTAVTWRARLAEVLRQRYRLIEEPLFSADHVIAAPAAKAVLAARTGAAAVDMESAGVAAAAAKAGMPCVVLRVIADGPDDALPDNIETLVTADGRTNYRGLLPFVVSPRRFSQLLRLARRSRSARRVLGEVARLLGEGAP